MIEPLNIQSVIESTAHTVRKRYKEYVELEDLISEGWVHVLGHQDQMDEYLKHDKPSLAAWWLGRDIWRKMDRFARTEKSNLLGYEVDDEQYYGAELISGYMPNIFAGSAEPPVKAQQEIRANGDPAEGGEWLAGYLDVLHAWQTVKLTENEVEALRLTFQEGMSQQAVGDALGVNQTTAGRTVVRALRKLSEGLGGPRPADCPDDCECRKM